MNVSLTPELEELVNKKVESGLYSSASEVVREALRTLREQDELKQFRFEELRKEISLGIEQADRGQVISGEEVFKRLRERNKDTAARK